MDSFVFQKKIAELESMIELYKDILENMDHSNLTASKLIGDQHRILKNFLRIANEAQKIDLLRHEQILFQAQETYSKLQSNPN